MIRTTQAPRPAGALAIATLLALGFALSARAQFPQHIANDDVTGEENRFDPAVAGLDGGRFLLLWVDNTRGQQDIVARRFDASLAPLSAATLVNDDGGISEQFGIVASPTSGGRTAAAWLDQRAGMVGVYAQVFRGDSGLPLGSNLQVTADRALGLRDSPAIATGRDGTSLVAWEEGTFARRRIRVRLISTEAALPGPEIEIEIGNPDRVQRRPAVAALPDGRWLVAWHENDTSVFELRYRILQADGAPTGVSTLVHTEAIVDPTQGPDPALLVRTSGVLLAWIDNSGGTADLRGHWLSLDGGLTGAPFLLRAAGDPARDNRPMLHAGPGGTFALTWFGGVVDRSYPLLRLFGADGTPSSAEIGLSDQGIGVVSRAGVALPLPGNEWLLAWADDRALSLQVYLRRITATGTAAGNATPALTVPASASQLLPDVARLSDGGSVVTWGDLRNGTFNIFARFLDHGGEPVGQSFQVNTVPLARRYSGPTDVGTYWDHRPWLSTSATGGFVLAWAAAPGGGAKELYGQLYDSAGQPVGDNFPVADAVNERDPQSDPRPSMTRDGSFAIAWHDNKGDTAGDDILVQRFSPLGARIGAPFSPVDDAGKPADQILPAIALSPFGDMVVAWADRRRGNWDIYRQRLDQQGRPIEAHNSILNPEDGPGNDQVNPSIATNGAAIVTVWEDRPSTWGMVQGRLEILESKGTVRAQTEFNVNELDHPSGNKNPRVSMDERGRFVVSWWDEKDGQRRVWARRYAADGEPMGEPYSIIGGETRETRLAVAAAADTAGIQFAWSDTRRGRGWDIYTRLVDWSYDGETTPVLLESAEARSRADGLELRWQLPRDAAGALYRAWRDPAAQPGDVSPTPEATLVSGGWTAASADGVVEILDPDAPRGETIRYFLEASLDGTRGEFAGPLEARWDPPLLAWSAGPNPARGVMRLMPPVPGAARAVIVDASGRVVRVLERRTGEAPLEWDGRDSGGREVPAGLYLARATTMDGPAAPAARLRLLRLR